MIFYWPGWEVFGSHPLLDHMLSGDEMTIRNDEGLYQRVDKAALLARYPSAMQDLRVCNHPYHELQNCCRCEKCIRTMLCFVASGNPIPPAFPLGLKTSDIGIGMGHRSGLDWAPVIFKGARRYGTLDAPEIKAFRRRYRAKWLKVHMRSIASQLFLGKRKPRWMLFETD